MNKNKNTFKGNFIYQLKGIEFVFPFRATDNQLKYMDTVIDSLNKEIKYV